MEWIQNNWQWITLVVTTASAIANTTKNDTDNKVMKVVNNILNTLALNGNVKGIANK